MEKLKLKYRDCLRAIDTLGEIFKEPFSIIVRDAAIQRFEYTFEAFWKFLREYLKEKEGLIVNSPKSCFREIFSIGLLKEEETLKCLDMTDRRNETAHTYREKVAQVIFNEIKQYYHNLMETIVKRFNEEDL